MSYIERRRRRSDIHSEALFHQLDTSRERAQLDAMLLVDDHGLCVAAAGDAALCDEFAVHTAMVCEQAPTFEGAVFAPGRCWDVHMQRFRTQSSELYLCAIGGSAEGRTQEIGISRGGVSRILAA